MTTAETCGVRSLHPEAVKDAMKALPEAGRLEAVAALFAALGDPTRLRLLLALRSVPLCTCDLAELLGVTDSAVSHQLRMLKALGLVRSERQERMMFHHLADSVVEVLTGVAIRRVDEVETSAAAA